MDFKAVNIDPHLAFHLMIAFTIIVKGDCSYKGVSDRLCCWPPDMN